MFASGGRVSGTGLAMLVSTVAAIALAGCGASAASEKESRILQRGPENLDTIYVSADVPQGAPQDGSQDKPFGSLQAAARAALEKLERGVPTRILIGPGIYREGFDRLDFSRGEARRTPLVIEGAEKDKVVISGADIFPARLWHHEGGGIWSCPWPHRLGNANVPWNKMKNVLGQRAEMAWLDGSPLVPRVLEEYEMSGFWTVDTPQAERSSPGARYVKFHDPREVLRPYTFGVAELEENGRRVFLRVPQDFDLRRSTVELAVRPTLLELTPKEGLVLRNLTFEKTASRTCWLGPVIDFGKPWENPEYRNIIIENCSFLWNSGVGLDIHHVTRLTVRGCRFNYNGMGGLAVSNVKGSLWERNETCFNGWREYMAGALFDNHNHSGAKFHESEDVLMRGHRSIGNFKNGLWFDIHCRNVIVEDALIAYNVQAGLFFELSQGPFLARRCVLANNDWVQYMTMVSGRTRVENSIMYASRLGGWSVHQYARSDEHASRAQIAIGESCEFSGNVVACGAHAWEGAALVSFTNSIREQGEPFERVLRGYRASGNWYFDGRKVQHQTFEFAIERDGLKEKLGLEGWLERWKGQEAQARWADPGFLDPARCDFSLQETSPLKARGARLPSARLEGKVLDELKAFFDWATRNSHAQPEQTLPQFLDFIRSL